MHLVLHLLLAAEASYLVMNRDATVLSGQVWPRLLTLNLESRRF